MTTSEQKPEQTDQKQEFVRTYSQELEQYNSGALDRVRKGLPAAALELKAAGVGRIEVQYDGAGDSGLIEAIHYYATDGSSVDPTGKVNLSDDGLMNLFYDLLQARHGGWENNDGACGEFQWNLEEDTLHHTHHDRFTDYDTTEHEGL